MLQEEDADASPSPEPDGSMAALSCSCSCYDSQLSGYTAADAPIEIPQGTAISQAGCYNFQDDSPPTFIAECPSEEACNSGWCQINGYSMYLPARTFDTGGCYLWHGGTRPALGTDYVHLGPLCDCASVSSEGTTDVPDRCGPTSCDCYGSNSFPADYQQCAKPLSPRERIEALVPGMVPRLIMTLFESRSTDGRQFGAEYWKAGEILNDGCYNRDSEGVHTSLPRMRTSSTRTTCF